MYEHLFDRDIIKTRNSRWEAKYMNVYISIVYFIHENQL